MLEFVVGLATTIVTAIIGGVVWGIRLEGRVNTAQALADASKEDLRDLLDVRFNAIHVRLERIERKQDTSSNGKTGH